jgi:hypothetical protein
VVVRFQSSHTGGGSAGREALTTVGVRESSGPRATVAHTRNRTMVTTLGAGLPALGAGLLTSPDPAAPRRTHLANGPLFGSKSGP